MDFLKAFAVFGVIIFAVSCTSKPAPEGMVFVKGGCFDMGDTFGDVRRGAPPVHKVCLDKFYMDKYEVTQGDFERVMGDNPSSGSECYNCPVDKVTWFEAKEYCGNVGKRLPTEAEWEYAAREGGRKVRFGTGKNTIGPDEANFDSREKKYKTPYLRAGEYREEVIPVGGFSPNSLGLHDMSGNVREWVSDWHDWDYYENSPESNPKGPSSGDARVIRGGSWDSTSLSLRAAGRTSGTPDFRPKNVGFRCSQ